MNLKHLAFEFDGKAIKDDGSFEGYASTFGVKDLGGDIMMPGAFTKSLQVRPAPRVKMLWQHDPMQPIGVWTGLTEDNKGLLASGRILTATAKGAEAYALMKAGAIDGLSIGYRTLDDEYDRTANARRLKTVDLHEISVVTFPMNTEATVSSVKELTDRELEAMLRDEARLSNRDAKAAVSVFRNLLRDGGATSATHRDDADAADITGALADLAARLRS